MRRTIVFAVLMGLQLALASPLVSVQHASISIPADARLNKAPLAASPATFPSASPSRAPATVVNQSAVDVILGTPKATLPPRVGLPLFSPLVTRPGNSSSKKTALSPAATTWLHASGDGSSSGSCNGSAHGVDTADTGLAAQPFDGWYANNPSKSFGDYLLRRDRNESNATGSTATARSPKSKFDVNLSDWIMSPAFTDKNVSDSHFASVTFPPPPAVPRRESKVFGDSFYNYSRGEASDKEESSASFSTYDPIRIVTLLLALSALTVFI